MSKVYEIKVIERVERTYFVSIDNDPDPEDGKVQAEEKLYSGEYFKMIDTNADIEEVLAVEESK